MRHSLSLAGLMLTAIAAGSAQADLTQADLVFDESPDHPAIGYSHASHDPVARLNRRIQEGAVRLKYDETTGYLPAVLKALHISVESQIVAFSKTSVQSYRITPKNPRTLFFNDSVVVGWVRGGFIELAAQDPQNGVIFYTLEQNPKLLPFRKPSFKRHDRCLACYVSDTAAGVAGMLLRSVFPGPDGTALYQAGSYITDDRSPMEQRWGGWYVTGTESPAHHLGNAILTDLKKPESMVSASTAHLDSLKDKFDTSLYLSPYSDVAALMVFDHQVRMMNLLTLVNWEARMPQNSSERLNKAVEEFVDYLLFVDEASLDNPIRGSSGFAEQFSSLGPRDRQGRSLRQLDLDRRLLRYPCSYMIYSEAFASLPSQAKDAIYKRLWNILSGSESGAKYARLTPDDRQVIVEILRDTKLDLPLYFQPSK